MMDGLRISIPQRMMFVRITLVCATIFSVLLSYPLWIGEREFPFAPLINLPFSRTLFDSVAVVIMLLCLTASMFLNVQRTLLFVSLLFAVLLVLSDINRLQPWFYIYLSMLAVYIFYNGRVDDSNRYTSFFIMLQVIFAAVYFFCGLNRLNCSFTDTGYTELIAPLKKILSQRQFLLFRKSGHAVPYLLMLTGIGLTISYVRYLAITFAVIMHLCLIILLFPSRQTEYALWFSNIAFLVLLPLLFSGKTKQRYFSPTFLFQRPLFYLVLALFVVMPFFNSSGRWPDYLSFNFKSDNNTSVNIMINEAVFNRLPVYQRIFCERSGSAYIVNYRSWSKSELKAECYPGAHVFNSILRSLAMSGPPNVKEIELTMAPREPLLCKQ